MKSATSNKAMNIAILGAFAFLILLVVSPDSWLHCVWDHHDSAWFFTCGKAWMSGMTPYVDFADSKGPLLWLIYGVGYLISPRDFVGVFVVSCLWYTATFYYCYRTAMLYLPHRLQAMMVTMVMAVLFFMPGIHYEVRAEDFMLLFSAMAIYHLCRVMCDDSPSVLHRASIVVGVCLAATFLIKYNGTLMLLCPAFIIMYIAWQRHHLWASMWRMAVGAAVVLVPFVVYMLVVGCLDDFVREYFINTLATLGNVRWRRINSFYFLWAHKQVIAMIVIAGGLSLVAFKALKRYRWVPLCVCLWYGLVIFYNAHWPYYYASLSITALLGLIAVFKCIRVNRIACVVTYVAVPIALGLWLMGRSDVAWFYNYPHQRADFNHCIDLMSRVERPRVLYYNMNGSYDIPVDGLPACRYWASQNGSTPHMDSVQVATIEQGQAHFVFMLESSPMNQRMDTTQWERIPSHTPHIMTMYRKK